ncbi:MAG: FG-GAP-like repeat-containing protein, partial [bacterium]
MKAFMINRSFLLLAISFTVTGFVSAAPSVISFSPVAQSTTTSRNGEITISFDGPMDVATLNASNIMIWGRWSGVASGSFQIENNNSRVRFVPSTLFSAGEWVTVSISKAVKNQSGENLLKGYAWNFWIKTLPGTLNLTETSRITARRTAEGHVQSYGSHGADLNKDGFSDMFVPNEISNDCRVYLNNGTGGYSNFTVYPIPNGSRPSTNESADFNHDGNIDIAVGNSTGDSITVFLGNGIGGFLSIKNYRADNGIRGLSVADLDGDGDADIVTANRTGNNIALLLNDGSGNFTSRTVMESNGNAETACAIADANNDGILDLFVGAYNSNEIILLLGNGSGGFTFSAKVAAGGSAPWKIAVGDVNGDGNVDVVSANANSNNCSVILGNGLGGLSTAVAYPTGVFPLSIVLGDIDGDGDLDLVTSNYSARNWNIYENNGSGVFINRRTLTASLAGSCATLHDRDNDG